jgi:hypothetical protein
LAIKNRTELEIESFENKLSCGVGMPKHDQTIAGLEALTRLIEIAQKDTRQSRRVADFLLAWHNAAENGGWDVTDLWSVDLSIADDMFTVLHLIRAEQQYPDDQGFKDEMQRIWQQCRSRR